MLRSIENRKLLASTVGVLTLSAASSTVLAHGYIDGPKENPQSTDIQSRADLCAQGANINCGGVMWEPQSLEAIKGFPESGPVDGQIASAGEALGSELDEQSSDRWIKIPMTAGQNQFEWKKTAAHKTTGWEYFITKEDWNPNLPLSRDALVLEPFCSVDGHGEQPDWRVVHNCDVPAREGYHIILGVWTIDDTVNAFYNVIDVDFGDGSSNIGIPGWQDGGTIYPSMNLDAGDQVKTRVFDDNQELPELQTTLDINSKAEGQANVWSHNLAEKINLEQTDIKAGKLTLNIKEQEFTPVYGINPIKLREESGLKRVEIEIVQMPDPVEDSIEVSGVESEYTIIDGQINLTFDVTATGEFDVKNTVHTHSGKPVGYSSAEVHDTTHTFTMTLDDVEPGHHMLVTVAKSDDGDLIQETSDFMAIEMGTPGEYDFIFPDGLGSYVEGTRVLQEKTGKVYECLPHPASGFCKQYNEGATHYEPGVGSNWTDAWAELK